RQWSSHTTTASGRQSWGWKSQPQKGTKTIFDFVFVPFCGSEFPLENQMMNRMTVFAIALAVASMITGCNFHKQSATNEGANHAAPAKPEAPKPAAPAQAGELQPGQASGTYTAKGQVVELKYAYAGRAVRFGEESMVILLTDQPIPPDALAEEIKSATL